MLNKTLHLKWPANPWGFRPLTFCQRNICVPERPGPALLCVLPSLAMAKYLCGHRDMSSTSLKPNHLEVFFRITATVYPQIWFWCQFTEKKKKNPELVINHKPNMSQQCHAVVKQAGVGWSSVSMSASCTAGATNPCSSWSSWGLSVVALWAPCPEGHGPARVRPGESSEVSGNGAKQGLQRGLGWRRMTEEGCGVNLLEGKRHRQRRTRWVFTSLNGTEKLVLNSMGKKIHFTH